MPDRMPVLSSSRHPFEVFTLVLCMLVGVPLMLGHVQPGTVQSLLPPFLVMAWSALLSGGAALALLGIVQRNRVNGVIMEQVGLVACGTASIVYSACLITSVGSQGVVAFGMIGSFGISCLMRWVQLRRLLQKAQVIVTRERRG